MDHLTNLIELGVPSLNIFRHQLPMSSRAKSCCSFNFYVFYFLTTIHICAFFGYVYSSHDPLLYIPTPAYLGYKESTVIGQAGH